MPLPLPRESERAMVPLKAAGEASSSCAGNSRSGLMLPSLDDSPATGEPVPASAICRVTPESAIAGDAADAAMSETRSAMAARYAMNRGFKSLPSYEMRPRRRGSLPTAQSPPSPRALVRVITAGWVVKRGYGLLIVRRADESEPFSFRSVLLPAGRRSESGHRAFRSDGGNVASRIRAGRRADRHGRMRDHCRRGTGGRGRRVDGARG